MQIGYLYVVVRTLCYHYLKILTVVLGFVYPLLVYYYYCKPVGYIGRYLRMCARVCTT